MIVPFRCEGRVADEREKGTIMAGRRVRRKRTRDSITVGNWSIESLLVRTFVQGEGPSAECDGTCCRHGVYASLSERDRIMENADRIKAAMDDTQTTDTSRWFDRRLYEDDDYPGGLCVGTKTYKNKCVFLDSEARCVLQTLEPELDLPEGEHLKPWYCFLFPITTWFGRVEFDDLNDGLKPCCTLTAGGATPTIDALEFEFKMLLGEDGYKELREAVTNGRRD